MTPSSSNLDRFVLCPACGFMVNQRSWIKCIHAELWLNDEQHKPKCPDIGVMNAVAKDYSNRNRVNWT